MKRIFRPRYTGEFKLEAIKLVTAHGLPQGFKLVVFTTVLVEHSRYGKRFVKLMQGEIAAGLNLCS